MSVEFVNLTPHKLVVYDETQWKKKIIPPSGYLARVKRKQKLAFEVDGIPVYETKYGKIVNLPNENENNNVIYIVSVPTLLALKLKNIERYDVIAPNTIRAIRDEKGKVIAVIGFQII